MKIVAIIPCYNVARYCGFVINEALPCVSHLIAVDDGSRDGTGQILQKLAAQHPKKLTLITSPKNQGKGFALMKGLKYALEHFDFDALATIDADGQHHASDLKHLADAISRGADMAIGTRSFAQMPIRSWIGNLTTSFLLSCRFSHAPRDTQSGLRAYNKTLAREIAEKIPGGHYETEYKFLILALKQQRKIEEIPILTVYIDKNASSHFRPLQDSFRVIRSLFHDLIGRT